MMLKYNQANIETVRKNLEIALNKEYKNKSLELYKDDDIMVNYLKKIGWGHRFSKFWVACEVTDDNIIDKVIVAVWDKKHLLKFLATLEKEQGPPQAIWAKALQGIFSFIGDDVIQFAATKVALSLKSSQGQNEQKSIQELDDNQMISISD